MSFDSSPEPLRLLLCLGAACYFLYRGAQLRGIITGKKFMAWALLKGLTLACLLLALLGPRIAIPATGSATIFLVDRSLSMEARAAEIEEFINHQLRLNKGGRDKAGVVSFARDPVVEYPVARDPGEVRLEAALETAFTDMEKALEFCAKYFPEGYHKRLVLITDGRENLGNSGEALRSLAGRGINLAVLPLAAPEERDVMLTSLGASAMVQRGEKFVLEAVLTSNYTARGTFRLFDGHRLVLEEPVAVAGGDNAVSFPVTARGEAQALFRGEISMDGDQNPCNNTFTISVPLQDSPGVLVIGAGEDTANIEGLLTSLSLTPAVRRPGEAPRETGELAAYAGVIMANVRHRDLPPGFETALGQRVEQQGAGLLVVGGDSAFGPGGYENTLLEQLLPVRSRMKGDDKIPDTGLVLVVDCSGSMEDTSGGVRKIEMVKEASVRAMEVLAEEDCLGVLAFSDIYEWLVPLGRLSHKNEVREEIGRLTPGGGTLIRPALERAVEVLSDADVKTRHIILLTDGQAEREGFDRVLQGLKAGGITLSTVAVGQDADRELLRALGEEGGGRSYHTQHYQDIPEIFTKETYLATKKYLNNREFTPRSPDGGTQLPALYGYTGTGLREGAELLLESDTGDPVLAGWQYGLGRVLVWTPDLSGKWSRNLTSWEGMPQFFGNLLDRCLGPGHEDGLDISVGQRGARVTMHVTAEGYAAGQSCRVKVFSPGGGEQEIALDRTGPGLFAGELELDQTGSYALDFRLADETGVLKRAGRAVHLDYSPEYAAVAGTRTLPLPAAFGEVIGRDTNVFKLPLENRTTASAPLDFALLGLALTAFIGELWVRKLF